MIGSAAHLEVVAGNATGMSILVADELVIGRHAEGAGRLAEDEEISRAHARVTVDELGSCEIEDLGSTNGTFVNALRISAPQRLAKGDTIELGATTLVVRELPTAEPEPAAPPAEPAAPPAEPAAPPAEPTEPALQPTRAGTAIPRVEPPADPAPIPAEPAPVPADQAPAPPEPAPAPPEPTVEDRDQAPPESGEDFATQRYESAADLPVIDEAAPVPPPLRIRLEIDFANRAAVLELDEQSPPVQLVFDAGRWQVAEPPS